MNKEALARIKINQLLQDSGWRFFDNEQGPANLSLETHVKYSKEDLDSGFDGLYQKKDNGHGYIDYLLLDKDKKPFMVLEAKAEHIDPRSAKEQARKYANHINAKYAILSNGVSHYLWNVEEGNPELITSFPTPESMIEKHEFNPNRDKLVNEDVKENYIALTQMPNYESHPDYINEDTRLAFRIKNSVWSLREYQLDAIKALQQSAKDGNDRFLFEMATGTGKTMISAAVIKLFLRTGNANRVLFLVDRLELEDQAYKAFKEYLKNDYQCVIFKENRDDWMKAEIVVTTIQSLMVNDKYKQIFSPTDFDLVISDESHRSISGNSRAVFEYFLGYKLGLTATPKDYLKKFDDSKASDPRELERRQLRDTYTTFGCESGNPTFRYSLLDGVKDGFLINPTVIDARTEISTQLLSDEGYSVLAINKDGEEKEATFKHKDFEKRFFSEETNRVFCETLINNALKDPISGEIGKSLVFCVSQKHAAKITQVLNELAHEKFPGKYNSDFAVQVTSWVQDAQQMTINFTNNNLNGKTKYLDGYKSSKTRMCVTVGMMTTGYDCPDVLNLALMRPIFSPTDFIQIKGRGIRKNSFSFEYKDELNELQRMTKNKETYKMFDFFANCEYFEEKYNYDEVLKLLKKGEGKPKGDGPVATVKSHDYEGDDKLTLETKMDFGVEGMKVDRMFFQDFESSIKEDELATQLAENDINAAAEYIKANYLNKPKEFYTLDKLRRALKIDRKISMNELVDKIFNGTEIKMKNQLIDDEFGKFLSIHKPENADMLAVKYFFNAYITDKDFRAIIDSNDLSKLYDYGSFSVEDFKKVEESLRRVIPQYIRDYVPLDKLAA